MWSDSEGSLDTRQVPTHPSVPTVHRTEPSEIVEAKQQIKFCSENLPAATKSRSTEQEEAEDKDNIIARLMQQLQEERQKNRVTSVTPPAATTSNNKCNDTTISPVLSNVNLRSRKAKRKNFAAAYVATPTGSRVMISGELRSGKENPPTSPETESPSLISAKSLSRKSTMMKTPTKRKRNNSVDVTSLIDENSDALTVTPSFILRKKLSPRRVNLVAKQIAGPSGANNQSNPDKKRKNKYERKIKECLYDSDDYNSSNLPKRKSFTKWDHEEISPDGFLTKIAMFHIHYGVSVPYKSWKRAITSESSYGFLRELVVPHIWSREEFVKRAIQVTRTHDSSNRLELSPTKRESLKRGYVQYLIERRSIPSKVSTEAEKESGTPV
ncbi:hypothetical protein TSAR_003584 [Trichomalopsis sarcophagae]|uniref:Uncharacterized protein n=1 Tax=Trichomalopsis sarcophagae TaxID=543379 RepID=A0A232FBM8_9HYME|nr:hypothetical protein TSAR_003584 [Trichomalopsis sarcophagae]